MLQHWSLKPLGTSFNRTFRQFQNFLTTDINNKKNKNSFSVEKSGRHHLNKVVKISINVTRLK